MSRDDLKVGVRIKKFLIITIKLTKFCYRSVGNHPFVAGTLLFLLFMYKSSPFLFSLLVSASPVLVCTAVLLGTLLSLGDPNIVPSYEEEELVTREIAGSKTSRVENTTVAEEESIIFREFRRDIVDVNDVKPLLDNIDNYNLVKDYVDIGYSSMHDDHISREVGFEMQGNEELKRVGVDLSDGEGFRAGDFVVEKVQDDHFEDYKLAEGLVDAQMRELLESLQSRNPLDEVLTDRLSCVQNVQHENFEDDYKSAEGSVDAQVMDQLEPSLASWKQLDELDDSLSPAQEVRDERFEGYQLAEESSEAQMRVQLESSLRSWEQFGSDRDEDSESHSESDGAESSSPDASMADIIPMLHELDPLLEDDIALVGGISCQSFAAKSPGSSIHSDNESDQKMEDGDDGRSEADDDETEGGKEDPEKSAIIWTEDDQKNLMDLGTSELERNQRLESLIARRRARKLAADRNLMELEGMDLPFPVAPISIRKHNPFDFPNDSYDDLGLPPIPGSAPSVMLARRNPFDLPYDSSEEKPDLTGDSFQQEFSELNQREAYNQREALFRRNETFNLGSSAFDFGRPSRFRPYSIPERSDSDVMSYASLQRQFSELSESKASSAGETDTTSVAPYQEEKKLTEHMSSHATEPSSEIDNASLLVEHGSQCMDDLDSLSGDDRQNDSVQSVPEVQLDAASSHFEDSHSDITMRTTLIEVKHNIGSSLLSVPKELHEVEDVSSSLVNKEESQVNHLLNLEIPERHSAGPSVYDITTDQSLEALDHSHTTVVDNDHPKEPIYDLSPLKKNLSISSSSSDLQREASGIDIYNLSRDLFVAEETYVHNKHAEDVSQHPEQDANENSSKSNDISEDSGLHSTKFSEHNQVLGKSQASVVAEDEGHLSLDTSESGVEEKLLDDKISLGGDNEVFVPGDSLEDCHEDEADADSSSDDTISSGGLEFLEESVLIHDEIEGDTDNASPGHSVLSCSTDELTEEKGMEMEVNQQFLVASLESHEVDVTEKLNFTVDDNHSLPNDSNDDNSADPAEQEQFMTNRELEEVGQFNKVDEAENIFKVREPQLGNLSDSLQTTVSSSQPDESVTRPTVELATDDHTQDMFETRDAYITEEINKISEDLEGCIADELLTHEKKSDIKELDETMLSELDAVGDFSVTSSVQNLMKCDIPAAVSSEAGPTTDSYPDADVSDTKESNLDSQARVVDAGFLVCEAQSVSDINAASEIVNEEVRNSVASESFHVESTGNEAEISIPEIESTPKDTEQERHASEVTEPERTQSDLALLEGQNLDSNRREIDIRMPVSDVVIVERSSDDAEKVAKEDFDSNFVEALLIVPETGNDCVEYKPLTDIENKEVDESHLVEGISSLAIGPRDETKSVGPIEFDSSQIDREIEGVLESVLLDACNPLVLESEYGETTLHRASIEKVAESESQSERDTSQSLPLDEGNEVIQESASMSEDHQREIVESSKPHELDINMLEVQESPAFEASVPSALEFEEKIVVQSLESESLKLNEDSGKLQDYSLLGASIISSPDSKQDEVVDSKSEPLLIPEESEKIQDTNALQEHISASVKSEEEKEVVGPLKSEPSPLDSNTKKIEVSPLVSASIASSFEFEEGKEVVESLEPELLQKNTLVEELRESNVTEEGISLAIESGDHIERPNTIESHSLQDDAISVQISSPIPTIASDVESADKIMMCDPEEIGPAVIDRDIGKFPVSMTPAVESEGQLERFYSVGFEFLQMAGDLKEFEGSSVPKISCSSIVEHKDEMEISSQMEDRQLVSQQQCEVDLPAGSEIHSDSSTAVAPLSKNEVDPGNSMNNSENISSQVGEKSHESHLQAPLAQVVDES